MKFGREKERLVGRLCASEEIRKVYERLRQVFLMGEFKNCVHPAIKKYITAQNANTLGKSVEMADDYFLSHKHLLQTGSPQQTFQRTFQPNKNKFAVSSSSTNTTDSKPTNSKPTFHKSSWDSSQDHFATCFNCRKGVMSFLSVLLYKEIKRLKKRMPSQMLLQH